jgi:hypothetical protein
VTRLLKYRCAKLRMGGLATKVTVRMSAYAPDAYAYIDEQVTVDQMRDAFAHRGVGRVSRYDLPLLGAFNFVLDDVLQGGVNGSLNLDGHGKSLSFLALSVTVKVPETVVENARQARESDRGE